MKEIFGLCTPCQLTPAKGPVLTQAFNVNYQQNSQGQNKTHMVQIINMYIKHFKI